MKKIPTIFNRNLETHTLTDEVNNECLWVFKGEGVATRKYDGTCCLVKNNKLYKRREVKKGKSIPENFIEEEYDENTGKRFGWLPVTDEDKWHIEAWNGGNVIDGTCELIGPKIQGNPENQEKHILAYHQTAEKFEDAPFNFNELKSWLKDKDIEGLVWHNPDGRMAKIKKRDFGLKRIPQPVEK